jgi:hypothetical protein
MLRITELVTPLNQKSRNSRDCTVETKVRTSSLLKVRVKKRRLVFRIFIKFVDLFSVRGKKTDY